VQNWPSLQVVPLLATFVLQLPLPSQLSAPLHSDAAALPHALPAIAWLAWQTPLASQVSCAEHVPAPEPHALPTAGEYAVVDRAVSHTMQGLPASALPGGTHTFAIRQLSQVLTQVSDATSHTSNPAH
jgi:hypothetical protein